MQAVAFGATRVSLEHLGRAEDLPEQHPVGLVLVADGAQLAGQGEVVRRVLGELVGVQAGRGDPRHGRAQRVVPEVGVLHDRAEHVEAEAVDTPVEPEADGVEHGRLHLGVPPVEVGLAGQERGQEPLPALLAPLPGALDLDGRLPVVGGLAPIRPPAVPPEVPVGLRVVPGASGLQEPGVLVGRVVEDQVEHHPQTSLVSRLDQGLGVGEGAVLRGDGAVVAHVVAEVGLWAGEEGGHPDGAHAEVHEVVEVGGDAREVPDAVAVRVGERPWVHLVDRRLVPPGPGRVHMLVHGRGPYWCPPVTARW